MLTWTSEVNALARVLIVPVWVKLPNLPVRYWNERSLSAICSLVGKPRMTDIITKDQTWLNFARVLIKVELRNEVIEEINFVNKYDHS